MFKPTVRTVCEDLAVAETAVVYTDAFEVSQEVFQTLYIEAKSAGTIAFDVEVEYSILKPKPNAVDIRSIVDPSASATSVAGTIFTYVPINFSPLVSMFVRFKITGTGSNHAGTTVSLYICHKDEA